MQYEVEFFSTWTYKATDGQMKTIPCHFAEFEGRVIPLYNIWHPVCPADQPEAAIERAKELAENTGTEFRLENGKGWPR